MTKHIAIYTDDPDKGGVAQYNHNVLLALAARGYQVTCIQPPSAGRLVQTQQAKGIRHEWIGYDPGRDFVRSIMDTTDAATLIERTKPDLILFSDCCPLSNLAAKHVALSRGIPIVIVVHFVAPYLAERFKSCLGVMGKHHAFARQVVAVSQDNLDLLRALFGTPAGKGVVIHNGRPAQYFQVPSPESRARLRAELALPENAVMCFSAARVTAIKGFQHIVAAAALLKQSPVWKNLHFVWAGDGELKDEMQRHIDALDMSRHFHLLGQRNDVCELYEAADLFLLPSHFEGMPLTVMEAMARRVPVIASAVSGIPEELGDMGRLIPNPEANPQGTVRALADAIVEWASDPAARRAAGEKGHERARELFREELMLERILALLAA